ncbi:MAG: DUF418 domain-containing protein [Elusimicrobia bacterium]|nr:DUF418 domain-containing protein [Elusimicrobiota bacterium]
MSDSASAGPRDPGERNPTLDALHGLALLFFTLVDLPVYVSSFFAGVYPPLNPRYAGLELAADSLVVALAFMKGLLLFAFLFGASQALIERRAGNDFKRLYARRLHGLWAVGAAMAVGVWYGSQLPTLVLVGVASSSLRARPPQRLLRLALVLFLAGLAAAAAAVLCGELAPGLAGVDGKLASYFARVKAWEDAAYSDGDWLRVARVRWEMFAGAFPLNVAINGLRMLAAALCGMAAVRAGVFDDTPRWRPALRRWTALTFAAGAPLHASALWLHEGRSLEPLAALIGGGSLYVGTALWAASFASALTLAMEEPALARLLAPVRDAGRMVLTNFVAASVFFAWLAYPYGLGLYGQLSRGTCLLVSLTTFGVLCRASSLWLSRYRFGPLEWLLRGWVYGRLPRLETSPALG